MVWLALGLALAGGAGAFVALRARIERIEKMKEKEARETREMVGEGANARRLEGTTLPRLGEPGERRVLVFVDSGCGHCQALLRALAESLPRAACACPVRVWVEGDVGLARQLLGPNGNSDRVRFAADTGETRRGLGLNHVPALLLVAEDDRIARVLEGERSRADLERELGRFCPPCAAP